MAIQILIHGKPLDPEQAVRHGLPLDTMLVCPSCESRMVEAYHPLTGMTLPGELQRFVPRQQDRRCLHCGHTWMSVLPPLADAFPHTSGGRR